MALKIRPVQPTPPPSPSSPAPPASPAPSLLRQIGIDTGFGPPPSGCYVARICAGTVEVKYGDQREELTFEIEIDEGAEAGRRVPIRLMIRGSAAAARFVMRDQR